MILSALPHQLREIQIAELPVIGASPDGLINVDATKSAQWDAVLELKAEVPFRFGNKRWQFMPGTTASSKVDASHYAQVQFEMLVTQKQHAYLVYWSCKATHIFKIGIDYVWLQEALALLRNIQKQYLSKGDAPPTSFYEEVAATQLRELTAKATVALGTPDSRVVSALNTNATVSSPFL